MTTERMTDEKFHQFFNRRQLTEFEQHGLREEAERARRVEQEQAEKIRKLEAELATSNAAIISMSNEAAETRAEWRDATGCNTPNGAREHISALHAKADMANDCIRLANDKMAEQVRQARWNVACEAIARGRGADEYLWQVRDANAPKD